MDNYKPLIVTFIVAFDRMIHSPIDMGIFLIGDYNSHFPISTIMNTIFHDYCTNLRSTKDYGLTHQDMVSEIMSGRIFVPEFSYPTYKTGGDHHAYTYQKEIERYADAVAFLFERRNPRSYFLKFEYVESDSYTSVISNGSAFARVPFLQIIKNKYL